MFSSWYATGEDNPSRCLYDDGDEQNSNNNATANSSMSCQERNTNSQDENKYDIGNSDDGGDGEDADGNGCDNIDRGQEGGSIDCGYGENFHDTARTMEKVSEDACSSSKTENEVEGANNGEKNVYFDDNNNNNDDNNNNNDISDDTGMTQRAYWKRANDSFGSHHLTDDVFTITIISNCTLRLSIIAIYVLFLVALIHGSLFSMNGDKTYDRFQIAVRDQQNASNYCLRNESNFTIDGGCFYVSDSGRDRIKLLMNTVVVDKGLDLSNWRGTGALPGTPPFEALRLNTNTRSWFLMDNSDILDFDANPQLHDLWNDTEAIVWAGHSQDDYQTKRRTFTIDLELVKTDGEWPSGISSKTFRARTEAYGCLSAGKYNCSSIGSFRRVLVNDLIDNDVPRVHEKGNVYRARLMAYSHDIGWQKIESWGWRFAILSDPGGAVSACLSGDNCVPFLVTRGTRQAPELYEHVKLATLVIYLIFFIWWTRVLIIARGRFMNWATENKWLFLAGIGFWTNVNPAIAYLNYLNPADRQRLWAAALITSAFGQFMLVFVAACFSDAPRRYVVTRFNFYAYKLLFCLVLWGASVVVILWSHPETLGRDEPGDDLNLGGLGFLTSPENWSRRDQLFYSIAMTIIIIGIFFGFFYYLWTNRRSLKALTSVPYNMTRPIQLSSRFFFFVTLLLITLEFFSLVFDYSNSNYKVRKEYSYLPNLTRWTLAFDSMYFSDDLNTFNADAFKCFFLIIFQCLFLPPSTFQLEKKGRDKVYYKTEEEAKVHYSKEKKPSYRMVSERSKLLMICATEVYLPLTVEEREALYPADKNEEETKTKSILAETAVSVSKAASVATKSTSAFVSNAIREIKNTKDQCTSSSRITESDIENNHNPIKDHRPDSTSRPPSPNNNNNNENKIERRDPRTDPNLIPEKQDRLAGEPGYSPRMFPFEGSYALGCRVVARIFEPDGIDLHESRAMIFRHLPTNDLIVTFRGTKTKKQIKTDLMAGKVAVDLDTFLTIPSGRFCGLCCSVENEEDFEQFEIPSNEQGFREDKKTLLDLLDKNTSMPDYLEGAYRAVEHYDQKIAHLHFGFWSSYNRLRKEIHQKVHDELLAQPGRLLIAGHSLGGAQAIHCAYDMVRWVLPTVKRKLIMSQGRASSDAIEVSCYTFGAPRPGNYAYMKAYNKAVPDTQRIVCEGDVITSVPPARMGFMHVGYESVFDVAGFVRVNPMLIDRKFSKKKTDMAAHATTNYRIAISKSFNPQVNEEDALDAMRVAYGMPPENDNYNVTGALEMEWSTPDNEASTNLNEAEEELVKLGRRASVLHSIRDLWKLSDADTEKDQSVRSTSE